jgi:hypothetical protein
MCHTERTPKNVLREQKFFGEVDGVLWLALDPTIGLREQEDENYVLNLENKIFHLKFFGPKFDEKRKLSGGHHSRVPNFGMKCYNALGNLNI